MLGLKLNHVSKRGHWGHQATTWSNVDLSSLKFSDIHLWAILQDMSHIKQYIIWEIFTFSSEFPSGQWIPGHVAWRQLLGYFFWQPVMSYGVKSLQLIWRLSVFASQWRHNEWNNVPNHQRLDCLLNLLFRRRSKKISKLRVTGLCEGKSLVTGKFPAQMANNAENVSNRLIMNVFVSISIPISKKGWATFRKLKFKMVRHTTGGVITWYVLFGKTSVYTINSLWPSGDIDLGQHWFRWWLVSWGHQATTWSNVNLSSMKFSDIHLWAILQDMPHIKQ